MAVLGVGSSVKNGVQKGKSWEVMGSWLWLGAELRVRCKVPAVICCGSAKVCVVGQRVGAARWFNFISLLCGVCVRYAVCIDLQYIPSSSRDSLLEPRQVP